MWSASHMATNCIAAYHHTVGAHLRAHVAAVLGMLLRWLVFQLLPWSGLLGRHHHCLQPRHLSICSATRYGNAKQHRQHTQKPPDVAMTCSVFQSCCIPGKSIESVTTFKASYIMTATDALDICFLTMIAYVIHIKATCIMTINTYMRNP